MTELNGVATGAGEQTGATARIMSVQRGTENASSQLDAE